MHICKRLGRFCCSQSHGVGQLLEQVGGYPFELEGIGMASLDLGRRGGCWGRGASGREGGGEAQGEGGGAGGRGAAQAA